jgi:hypothetical protein
MSGMPTAVSFARLMTAAAFLAVPTLAQQAPLDLESNGPMEGLTFQVFAPTTEYSIAVEECPDSDAQCAVIRNEGAWVSMTYEFDAAPLRGKRVRFAASLLVDYPAISQAQLFLRVDRPAGVGFHEYSPRRKGAPREWTTPEIVGTVDPDAKRIVVGLRFSGRGAAYFAEPTFETVSD